MPHDLALSPHYNLCAEDVKTFQSLSISYTHIFSACIDYPHSHIYQHCNNFLYLFCCRYVIHRGNLLKNPLAVMYYSGHNSGWFSKTSGIKKDKGIVLCISPKECTLPHGSNCLTLFKLNDR